MDSPPDAHRWTRIKTLFDEARTREGAEREAFLENACGGDPALRAEIDALLRASNSPGVVDDLMDQLDTVFGREVLSGIPDDARVGPYELIEELGRGGMGRVFLARRADGQFERTVALKLLGITVPSEEVRERFLKERQILATLEHPNIARMLDGGVTDGGQPYFVMEAVDGHPIDEHCTQHGLPVRKRLRLFLEVCDAVRYAHQNLVVHRDLKPANILVTEEGTVKLLDFGIAKGLDPTLARGRDTTLTRSGVRVMTPNYASPEQVRGASISTASDVYQLGMVLYELMTGHRPYQVDGCSPSELERIVCEQRPPAPSTAVLDGPSHSDGADGALNGPTTAPGISADRLHRILRGDLDTIILTALRKDPVRRYDSVERLADDLRRFLSGKPVSAHPDGWLYRSRKFVQRHPWGIAATLAILVLTIGYGVTITWHSQRTEAALEQARNEARKAEQVTDFLVTMFERVDPYSETDGSSPTVDTLTTNALLAEGTRRVRQELSGQPEVQATMMRTLGRIYRQIGRYDHAQPLLEDAVAIQDTHQSSAGPDRARSLHELGRLHRHKGEMTRARQLYEEALTLQREHVDGAHRDIAVNLRELGIIAARSGQYSRADSLFRAALSMQTSLHGSDHPSVATELHALGLLHVIQEEHDDAERLLRRSLRIRRRHVEGDHPMVAETLDRLGQVLVKQGRIEEAAPLLREAQSIRQTVFPEVHPSRAVSLNNVARLRKKQGDYAAADSLFQDAQSIYQQLYGNSNLDAANTLYERAQVHRAWGHYAMAERLYKRAEAMQRSIHGPEHPAAQESRNALVQLYRAWDKPGKADSVESVLVAAETMSE